MKIGFTNTAVWDALGLADPICAPMYEGTVREVRDGVIDIAAFVAPAIEPEVVVGIGEHGIAWWALGFEVVQCHYHDWQMTPADAIADYGLHAVLIVGERLLIADRGDPAAIPAFDVELLRNGDVYERGSTSAVLGGPLRALERAFAINREFGSDAPAPQPGEVVTTGSLTSAPRVLPVKPGRLARSAPPCQRRRLHCASRQLDLGKPTIRFGERLPLDHRNHLVAALQHNVAVGGSDVAAAAYELRESVHTSRRSRPRRVMERPNRASLPLTTF